MPHSRLGLQPENLSAGVWTQKSGSGRLDLSGVHLLRRLKKAIPQSQQQTLRGSLDVCIVLRMQRRVVMVMADAQLMGLLDFPKAEPPQKDHEWNDAVRPGSIQIQDGVVSQVENQRAK